MTEQEPRASANRWQHVPALPGMGVEEQWIYRWQGRVPAISLKIHGSDISRGKRDVVRQGWHAELLLKSGISCKSLAMPHSSLTEAQAEALVVLNQMGWEV